jgi:hypothetical protein
VRLTTPCNEAHHPIRIFDIEFRPSEALFQLELKIYRVKLGKFDAEDPGFNVAGLN